MPTDYKGDKQKPSKMALIISVGPKMPKSPEDTSKPDDKAMKKAWDYLKADESYTGQPKFGGNEKRRQPFNMDEYFRNQAPIQPMNEPDNFMNYPPDYTKPMDQSPYKPTEQSAPPPYDMRNPPAEPRTTAPLKPYQPLDDEEINRILMEMLPPIPPREERRANMMRDGTPYSPGQQSMIDRATEMYRQQKLDGHLRRQMRGE